MRNIVTCTFLEENSRLQSRWFRNSLWSGLCAL